MPPNENESKKLESAEKAVAVDIEAGGAFVVAVQNTRMPIIFSDPRLPGNPIIYANDSFLALTGNEREEVLGQTYHFMMGLTPIPPRGRRSTPRSTRVLVLLIPRSFTTARTAANSGQSCLSARFLTGTALSCSTSPRLWMLPAGSRTRSADGCCLMSLIIASETRLRPCRR